MFSIFNRNFPISKLIPLLLTINLRISISILDQKISLHTIVDCKSTINKIPVFCKYKDKNSLYATQRCAYVKARVKYRVACHRKGDNDNIEYFKLNISYLYSHNDL